MMINKVNLLLCDTFPGLLPESIPSHEYLFEKRFHSVDPNIIFKVYRTLDGELPEHPAADELYLITGSNNAAYDTLPWILSLQEWIRMAAKQQVPLVGICFGHQVIAQALGGRVERYAGGWGVGIREMEVLDKELLPWFPDNKMRLIVNHHDQVMELPEGAIPLATSDFCRYESFRIGHHILTFQGHPEFTVDYERHLILNHAEDEDDTVKRQALTSLETMEHQGKRVVEFLLGVL
ncbi:MAG: type 1 glutamine amidotransferase [Bacteroidales bacterium]|nr:type 1 glutamine amidotransferase [Bacteroidales bacterium]